MMKKISVAYLTLIFGVHYFYLEQPKKALLYLLTCGGAGFWFLFDLIRMKTLVDIANSGKAKSISQQGAVSVSRLVGSVAEPEYIQAVQQAKRYIGYTMPILDFEQLLRDYDQYTVQQLHGTYQIDNSLRILNESYEISSTTIRTETACSRYAQVLKHLILLVHAFEKVRKYELRDEYKMKLIQAVANIDSFMLSAASREIAHEAKKIESSKTQATRSKRIAAVRTKFGELEEHYKVTFSQLDLPPETMPGSPQA